MADVQMNLNVKPETKNRLQEMADATYRKPGDMLDLIVAEAYQRMQMAERNRQVLASGSLPVAAPLVETAEVAK